MTYLTLSNGVKIPQVGYGVYQVTKEECKRCVLDALSVGYRHIDTAQAYFNESEVGEAILESGIDRKDIFLTTKVWIDNYGEGQTYDSIIESLKKLKTDYIDLILLHQAIGDVYGAYRDLVKLYNEGKVKAIGISNFRPYKLAEFALFNDLPPMVNQIELHPLFQQDQALDVMKKYDIIPEAWAPLGEGRKGLFTNEILVNIGKKYNKTSAQVMLRWNLERGVVILPKSTHKERMIENLNIFDFELSTEDKEVIKKLDTNSSSFFEFEDPNTPVFFANLVKERKNKK